MKKRKQKNIVISNICRLLSKLRNAVKDCVYCVKDKLLLNVNDTDRYGYVDLGPTNNAQNVSEYMRALEWAINDKNITNIAITGPYGAGKSSIINTFLNKHPSIKHINISLATFGNENREHIGDITEEFEKKLEEGILKQLFYKAHYSRIPQSRYRKLHKVSFWTSLIRVIATILMAFCFAALFAPTKLRELAKTYSDEMSELFGWNELYQALCAVFLGIVIIFIMTMIYRWIHKKWKSIELNVADKAVLKADEMSENLSLNRNMDEILYFFEETNYTLVVIEDIDRFDNPDIYTKLREINKIINDYDAIKRRIVFVYAMKDDIFFNEDRTKFFDFIIPVVSYIDATNSGEYLKNRLYVLKNTGLQFDVSNEYIMNVAPFITDMRLLNNICNEFIIYKKTIKDSQNLMRLQDEHMLSIMIFKNMYPEEFAKLQEPEGIIKQMYSKRSEFIEKQAADLKKEIECAENEKKKSDSQEILSAEDVKLAFLMKIVGDKGVFVRVQGTKGAFTKNEILKGDFALSQIGNGTANVFYRQINIYGNEASYTVRDIEKTKCSDGMTYYEKCDRAIARDKNRRKQIAQDWIDKQNELYVLRSKNMEALIKEYGADNVLGEEMTKNKLLLFMLRHGYIDDTYQMYINYFLPGSITAEELNFILNVRNYAGETGLNYSIMHPHDVISRLFDYELEQQKECLNYDLADYFYADDKRTDKKTGFTKQLAKPDSNSRIFIKEYYKRTKNKAEFIRNIALHKPLFWFDICSDESLGYQDKISYLKDIFMYLKPEDIVLQDTAAKDEDPAYSIHLFIIEADDALGLLQEAGADKVISVLTQINVKLKDIDIATVDSDIVRGVYENELYEIALPMLQKYADFKVGEAVIDFSQSIYTHILELGDAFVIDYLEKNIIEFVSGVVLETEDNTQETVDTTLRCIQLLDYDEDLSIRLIQKMDIVMDKLQDWISSISDKRKDIRKIVDTFLRENKLKATIENLDTYITHYKFSHELCTFVDENIDSLLSDESIDDSHVKEFLKKDIQDRTIERILKEYKMDSFSENLNSYREKVVQNMISLKYFKYSRSRYTEILSAFPDMLPLFIKNYWDEFEPEIAGITFDFAIIDRFIESDLDDGKKAVFLNRADASKMTETMYVFVRNTNASIPKSYLLAAWNKMEEKDRPEFLVRHFTEFSISEIQNMFAQMPKEYHALKREDGWHEALLEKNKMNEALCKMLLSADYISSYDIKKEKSLLFGGNAEKYVARVKAKR